MITFVGGVKQVLGLVKFVVQVTMVVVGGVKLEV